MTTWYDVHETLIHILFDGLNPNSNKESNYQKDISKNRLINNKPNGVSLFFPIPERNCEQAKIPEYLCSCDVHFGINKNSTLIQQGTQFMIDHINNELLGKYQDICMRLELINIIEVQGFRKNPSKYAIIFVVGPNNATFDGTISFEESLEYEVAEEENANSDKQSNVNSTSLVYVTNSRKVVYDFKIVGKIVRINTYGVTSKCISSYQLKNFCYCYSYEKNKKKAKI
jgi:hypothetical protein